MRAMLDRELDAADGMELVDVRLDGEAVVARAGKDSRAHHRA